ncbi:sushi, von Willebrand factor type A, EGF and pentraxin domain-containing protein 1-like [Xiphophorus hellerii]|uniref:sushi, von Willebrand factor type A, EGF and pentraxin domain-containing protein 1-like n=1 Tax=Xiphophorus hellerii TaxID=8084 RepID=UPI0013B3903F|nr:sushi, von Willebrand factor type A, EGF and pentraxin domain-containing protein 1-like [Xiphophorus hellerii]
MVGTETIRCTETAEYDYEPPQCIAYCPIPKGGENMVLTDESLLRKDFPEGTNVIYECGNGYEKESGSEIITCIGGNWTEPDLICKKNTPRIGSVAIIAIVCSIVGIFVNSCLTDKLICHWRRADDGVLHSGGTGPSCWDIYYT